MAAWATSLKISTATRPSGLAAVSRRRGAWQKYCGRWWRMFTDCGRCYSRRFQLRRPERPPSCGLRYRDRPVCGRAPIHKQRMYVTSGCSVSPEDSQARARASAQAGQGVPAPSSGLPRSPPEKNSCAALSAACWAGYGHRPNGDSSLGHFRSRDGFATESQCLIPELRSPTVGLQTTRMALRRRIRDLRTPPERRQTLLSESQTRSEEQRLNSSHSSISYAVFCLKKKKNQSPGATRSDITSYRRSGVWRYTGQNSHIPTHQ